MTKAIGLVGCGRWGKFILRDLKDLNCRVEVVARSDQAAENARQFGADAIVKNTSELSTDIDGYVVATPTVTHVDVIRSLLPKGRPIFVEKPISDCLDEVLTLPDHAFDCVFAMHKWRYHPGIEEMRKIAQSGEFGSVIGLRTRRVQWGNPHQDTDAVWILAPHDISIATHIFEGVPRAVKAIADPFIDRGAGLVGELVDSTSEIPITIEISDGYGSNAREITLACRDGVVFLTDDDYASLSIRPWPKHFNDNRVIEVRKISNAMPLRAELQAFVEHLQGGPAPMTNLRQETEIIHTLTNLRKLADIPNRRN